MEKVWKKDDGGLDIIHYLFNAFIFTTVAWNIHYLHMHIWKGKMHIWIWVYKCADVGVQSLLPKNTFSVT